MNLRHALIFALLSQLLALTLAGLITLGILWLHDALTEDPKPSNATMQHLPSLPPDWAEYNQWKPGNYQDVRNHDPE